MKASPIIALGLVVTSTQGFAPTPTQGRSATRLQGPPLFDQVLSIDLLEPVKIHNGHSKETAVPSPPRLEEYSGLFTLEAQNKAATSFSFPSTVDVSTTDPEMIVASMHLATLLSDIQKLKEAVSMLSINDKAAATNATTIIFDAGQTERNIERLVFKVARHMETTCNILLGSDSFIKKQANRAKIADILKEELRPFLQTSRFLDRCIRKPRGYAGDFDTIDFIYDNQPGGIGSNRRFGESLIDMDST